MSYLVNRVSAAPRPHSIRLAKKPKRRYPPEVFTPEEVRSLIEACPSDSPAGLRNRALLAVLYRTGVRINEALSVRPIDLDPRKGAVRILNGKGGKARTVGMDHEGFAILTRWLDAREEIGVRANTPVFCLIDGRRLNSSYIRVLLPRLASKAGITRRIHAHGLRHTHAAELRAEGVDIGVISKQLGHRSIATTARYLDHIAPWNVVEAMQKRAWG